MTSKHLLLLTLDYPPNRGGIARYLQSLSFYFQDRIEVISSTSLLLGGLWPKWMRSVRLLMTRRFSYDIVLVSHILPLGTAAMVSSWFTKKPYLVITHGMDIRLAIRSVWKRWLTAKILQHAKIVVTNSNALSDELAALFHIHALMVYPCLTSTFPTKSNKHTDHEVRLLTVSRLVNRKGHKAVLLSLSKLVQEGKLKNYHYDIVGNGPMREQIIQLAQQLHLDRVQIHTDVDDEELSSFYEKSDLFIMPVLDDPIDKEGFGLVFLEAAMHGIPSISTDLSGVNEAIVNGQTGILVKPGDGEALSQAIDDLANSPNKRQHLGEQARLRALRDFTCKQQFGKLEPYL